METNGATRKKRFCRMCGQPAHNRFSCPLLIKFGHVQNGRNVQVINELADQLCNRHGDLELDHDPDPSTTLFVTFPSKVHGLILHNRYLRGNDIVVVCTLVKTTLAF